MKVAMACIAKNEDKYIHEWCDYNLKIGFDDIFVYQNNWVCPVDHPNVIKVDHPTIQGDRQTNAYNRFATDYQGQYDYVAFFDVDEFLVLKKHKNVKEFLADYPSAMAIGINWAMFGNNNLTEVKDNDYSMVKRFTRRAEFWPQIKSISKMVPGLLVSSHHPISCDWISPDEPNVPRNGADNHEGSYNIAQLNHYWCKTPEEFKAKQAKGRVCDNPLGDHEYDRHNRNEVEDLHALRFVESFQSS